MSIHRNLRSHTYQMLLITSRDWWNSNSYQKSLCPRYPPIIAMVVWNQDDLGHTFSRLLRDHFPSKLKDVQGSPFMEMQSFVVALKVDIVIKWTERRSHNNLITSSEWLSSSDTRNSSLRPTPSDVKSSSFISHSRRKQSELTAHSTLAATQNCSTAAVLCTVDLWCRLRYGYLILNPYRSLHRVQYRIQSTEYMLYLGFRRIWWKRKTIFKIKKL